MNTYKKILNFFKKPELSPQAFEAYFYRLPDAIKVDWKRDGNFIVGHVKAGDKEFDTQGENADDFIRMVNDAMYTVYEIPFDYIEEISKQKAFHPNQEDVRRLYDGKIPTDSLSMLKNKKLHAVA